MKNTALIIGGSSGIGLSIAKLLASYNYDIILLGRNQEKLIKLQKTFKEEFSIKIEVLNFDLSKETEVNDFFDKISSNDKNINFILNCIGLGYYGDFVKAKSEINNEMINLNLSLFIKLNQFFVEHMLRHNLKSHIVCMGSLGGFVPNINNLTYGSCKKFIEVFTFGLRERLKNTNISVTLLAPGQTETNFLSKSKFKNLNNKSMSPETVAKIATKKILKGKKIIVPGFLNNFRYFLFKLLPISLIYLIYRLLNKDNK